VIGSVADRPIAQAGTANAPTPEIAAPAQIAAFPARRIAEPPRGDTRGIGSARRHLKQRFYQLQ
jgi:hypothetical protein